MSKKSVASIKTLARYEPDTVYIGTGEYVAECVRADDGDYYLAADADAAIEALQAEIEGLREQLRLSTVDQATAEAEANDARAKVEALRAEVEAWRELSDHVRVGACSAIWPDRYVDERIRDVAAALKRAERLAEALRELVDLKDNVKYSFPNDYAVRKPLAWDKARALLRDQEEGK